MNEPLPPSSALDDYRATFGSSFDVRRLWGDRRTILANPRVATELRPPLAFPPLRFALTLVIVPMLAIGWLTAQLAGLMFPDGPQASPIERATRAIEAPLDRFLDVPDATELRVLAAPERRELGAEGMALLERGRAALDFPPFEATPDVIGLGEASQRFVDEVKASTLTPAQQRQAAAEILNATRARRRIDHVTMGVMRSFMEGGAAMQIAAALGLIVTAWMFRRLVRRDARFPRGDRAGALYLYYGTSRLFWISMASIAAYGVMAFASAKGDTVLLRQVNHFNLVLAGLSLVYLLFHSAAFARALREDDALPKGTAFALGARLLASQLLANLVVIVGGMLAGILIGLAAAMWYLRG